MGGVAAMITVNLFERIRELSREGYGYEDIGYRLNIPWRQVRPFVIGDRYDHLSSLRDQTTAAEREAEKL